MNTTSERFSRQLLGDPLFSELKDLLIQATGLVYYADKDAELADRIHGRMKRIGVLDCAAYLDLVRQGTGPGSELDALVTELTVGETHFFRHGEQLEAIRTVILPDLLERNRSRRRLRVWSAGCASGPEAYTLSILLRRELGYRLAGWDVSVVGTDINRKFLALAREGRFGAWALRSTPEKIQQSCFRREQNAWILRQEYREWVSFQYHNLVQNAATWLLDGLSAFDLILCRNVLIYFDRTVSQGVVRRFRGSLADGGWLVVGDVENQPELFRDFRRVRAGGTSVYQKSDDASAEETAVTPIWEPRETEWTASLPSLSNPPVRLAPAIAPVPAPRAVPSGPVAGEEALPTVTLADVRRLADQGELDEAERCCERLLERDRLDPFAHFYLALVRDHMGHKESAAESLRKAIYLDRGLALAHYYLGIMREKEGNSEAARKSFDNVLDLLSRNKPDDLIEGGDGLTTRELKELAENQRQSLENGP